MVLVVGARELEDTPFDHHCCCSYRQTTTPQQLHNAELRKGVSAARLRGHHRDTTILRGGRAGDSHAVLQAVVAITPAAATPTAFSAQEWTRAGGHGATERWRRDGVCRCGDSQRGGKCTRSMESGLQACRLCLWTSAAHTLHMLHERVQVVVHWAWRRHRCRGVTPPQDAFQLLAHDRPPRGLVHTGCGMQPDYLERCIHPLGQHSKHWLCHFLPTVAVSVALSPPVVPPPQPHSRDHLRFVHSRC